MRKIAKSFSLQFIVAFLEEPLLILLQAVNHRFYKMFVPAVLNKLTLFQVKGYCVLAGHSSIKRFDNFRWTDVELREKGDT